MIWLLFLMEKSFRLNSQKIDRGGLSTSETNQGPWTLLFQSNLQSHRHKQHEGQIIHQFFQTSEAGNIKGRKFNDLLS